MVVNLAYALAEAGVRVLVVDLDPQGALAPSLGLQDAHTDTYSIFLQNIPPDQVVQKTSFDRLELIPGPSPEKEIEGQLKELAPNHILDWFGAHKIAAQYDYVFFDLPPTFGPIAEAALAASDHVLLVKEPDPLSFRILPQELAFLKKIQQQYNPFLRLIGLLLNKFDPRDTLMNDIHEALMNQYGEILIRTLIPRDAHIMEAMAVGKPVILYERLSGGARAFLKAAQELEQRELRRS